MGMADLFLFFFLKKGEMESNPIIESTMKLSRNRLSIMVYILDNMFKVYIYHWKFSRAKIKLFVNSTSGITPALSDMNCIMQTHQLKDCPLFLVLSFIVGILDSNFVQEQG